MRRTGRWSFVIFMAFFLGISGETKGQNSQDLAGAWQGTLEVPGMKLRLVFHLEQDSAGSWQAKMDSPDQGAKGIPVSKILFENMILCFRK